MTKPPKYPPPPLWFQAQINAGTYDKAENLDDKGWAKQLHARLAYLSPEAMCHKCELTVDDKEIGYSCFQEVKLIQQQGIVKPHKRVGDSKVPTYQGLTELILCKHHIDDLNRHVDDLDGLNYEFADYGYLSAGLGMDSESRCLSVDLIIPKTILMEQFEKFIDSKKRELKDVIGEAIELMDGKKKAWFNFAVLPYLDLEFWANENKISLPYSYYALHIFKQYELKDGATVLRTTKPRAEEFLDIENYQKLMRLR